MLEVGLALVIVAAGAALANRLNVSVIPVMIIIGIMFGSHMPQFGIFDFRFENSKEIINFLGRIGVLFLLFYLGLEFSVSKLARSGRSILYGGSLYIIINFSLGLIFGYFANFALYETLIIAGLFAVSSSAIVAKVLFDLKRLGNRESELILGMIVADDIFLAVYLTLMSGLLLAGSSTFWTGAGTILLALGYMMMFFVIALKARCFLDKALDITSDELFVLTIFAIMFFVSGFSEAIHVAEAIGALLIGLVITESKHSGRLKQLVAPFRDFFGAIFFFNFGLKIDPFMLQEALWLSLIAALITLGGNIFVGMLAGKNAGLHPRKALNIGLTMSARGELSIIIASLGVMAGLSPLLQSFTAVYVLYLSIISPILTKNSEQVYELANGIFKFNPPESEGTAEDKI